MEGLDDGGVRDARLRLMAWRDVASWMDYAATEFIADQATRCYLEHVATCVRDEGERREAAPAQLVLPATGPPTICRCASLAGDDDRLADLSLTG
jgi:hypothetical protein